MEKFWIYWVQLWIHIKFQTPFFNFGFTVGLSYALSYCELFVTAMWRAEILESTPVLLALGLTRGVLLFL